jgi:POT family proton-dependent oligopeptide transporter
MPDSPAADSAGSAPRGQPRGLYTLFFTEMWERFSYYGMRGLLILFLMAKVLPWVFSTGEINDLKSFTKKLKDKSDGVSMLVGGRLDKAAGDALALYYLDTNSVPTNLESVLDANLNSIISGPCIYDKAAFAPVTLRPATQKLLDQNPQDQDGRMRLNRLLLEDAYPGELSKTHHVGFGLPVKMAAAIYGLFTAGVYLAALLGGWIADRFVGAQKAVWYGGITIMCGDFLLAVPRTDTFYIGLCLLVLGTGLLKPNVSAIVGELYPEGGARRDAGFSIFYMGINLGAFVAPLLCGPLAMVNYRYGFALPGLGMLFGLLQYRFFIESLGQAGSKPGHQEGVQKKDLAVLFAILGAAALIIILTVTGVLRLNPVALAQGATGVILGIAALFFFVAFFFLDLDPTEKKRLGVILVLFLSSAMFWSGFEQAGSSLNIFAEDHTQRIFFGHEIPATYFQSLGPLCVILLAPVMGALWLALARRKLEPSLPVKFGSGLLLLAGGFAVIAWAATYVVHGDKVLPTWLIIMYLLHTFGELCVSPVGLSSVTKLAPKRLVGQMMGIWFLATALGNLIAGQIAGSFDPTKVDKLPAGFFQIVLTAGGTGVVVLLLAKPIRKLMSGVK